MTGSLRDFAVRAFLTYTREARASNKRWPRICTKTMPVPRAIACQYVCNLQQQFLEAHFRTARLVLRVHPALFRIALVHSLTLAHHDLLIRGLSPEDRRGCFSLFNRHAAGITTAGRSEGRFSKRTRARRR